MCYHIECVSNELCLPILRPDIKPHFTMFLVNPVLDDGKSIFKLKILYKKIYIQNAFLILTDNWQELLDQSNYGNDQILPNSSLEDEIISNLENVNQLTERNPIFKQAYSSDIQEPDIISRFSENMNSKDNFINRPSSLSQFLDKTDQQMIMDASEYFTEKIVTCEVGIITDCPLNEECISIITKSRSGVCKCLKGFMRNVTGYCERPIGAPYSADFDVAKVGEKETSVFVNAEENTSKLKKDDPSTKTIAETSSEPNIKKLTVSAISKEVRLPENEVTLFSYTIPDEKSNNDHYNYMWTLVKQPKGGSTGMLINLYTLSTYGIIQR